MSKTAKFVNAPFKVGEKAKAPSGVHYEVIRTDDEQRDKCYELGLNIKKGSRRR